MERGCVVKLFRICSYKDFKDFMDNLKAVWLIFFVKPKAPLEIVRLEVCIHRIFLIQFMGYVGGQYAHDSRMVESG